MTRGADDSVFRIADLRFRVTSAVLSARLANNSLHWTLRVSAAYERGPKRIENWTPVFLYENIEQFRNRSVNRWSDLLDEDVSWKEAYDPASRKYRGSVYVFDHNDAYDCTIRFSKRVPSRFFRVMLLGRCDVGVEGYEENLELEIRAETEFVGITVIGDENEARRSLSDYVRSGDFEYVGAEGEKPAMLKPRDRVG